MEYRSFVNTISRHGPVLPVLRPAVNARFYALAAYYAKKPAPLGAGFCVLQRNLDLFAEDFLHVANFALYFAFHLFGRAAVLQIRISNRLTRFLFDFACHFFGGALDFIACA